MDKASIQGRDEKDVERAIERALEHGVSQSFIEKTGGYTGISGILDTGRPGPTIAIRADLDAVPVQESSPSLADSGKQKALNSLIISEFRAFLNYCLVYMLEHVFNQFRNCLLCCKSYS